MDKRELSKLYNIMRELQAALVVPQKYRKPIWDDVIAQALAEVTHLQFLLPLSSS